MLSIVLAATLLAAPHAKKQDTGHAHAHAVQAVPAWGVGALVTRDLEDGPTLIGCEITGRSRSLGLRMTLSGGDRVTRSTADVLRFFCPKPIQAYVGVGMVFDCVEERPTPRAVTPPPAPRDPPSLIAGIQGRTPNALFGEARYTFGDPKWNGDKKLTRLGIGVGIRHRF